MSETTKELLGTLDKVLLRCWIFGLLLNLLLFAAMLTMGEIIHDVHGLIGLSAHESDIFTANYAGLIKALAGFLFFIPWVAVKLVLNKEAKKAK